jgi:hypothetical protein
MQTAKVVEIDGIADRNICRTYRFTNAGIVKEFGE